MTQEIHWRLVENLNLSIGLDISPRRPLPVARRNDLFRVITSSRCMFIASILCSLVSNIKCFWCVCACVCARARVNVIIIASLKNVQNGLLL